MEAYQYATEAKWTQSDKYHNSFLLSDDTALQTTLDSIINQGLPEISVSAAQGKFLYLLALSIKAERILEVGTLGGYSTIWMARALPKYGSLTSLELEEKHAKLAKSNVENAGLGSVVDIIVGPAQASMEKMKPEAPFDFVFIDADKESNVAYFKEAKRLLRSGGVIIVDNVVRKGKVSNLEFTDSSSEGVRALLRYLKDDKEVECTTMATVGEKGYDGFLYAVKK